MKATNEKPFVKTIVCSIILLTSFCHKGFGQILYKWDNPQYHPRISILFEDPVDDAEANSELLGSLKSISNESLDYGFRSQGYYSEWYYRWFRSLLGLGIDGQLDVWSHEYAHLSSLRENDIPGANIHLGLLSGSHCSFDVITDPSDAFDFYRAGPMQDRLNRLLGFEDIYLKGHAKHYEWGDQLFLWLYPLLRIHDVEIFSPSYAGRGESNDYQNIVNLYNNRFGHDISMAEIQRNSRILSILSLDVYQALWDWLGFNQHGQLRSEPFYFDLTHEIEVGLPHLTHVFKKGGDVALMSVFMRWDMKYLIELNAWHDLDRTHDDADADTFGIGGQLHNLQVTDDFYISPIVHLGSKRSKFDPQYSFGFGWIKEFDDHFILAGEAGYNYNGLIKSDLFQMENDLFLKIKLRYEF